MPYTPSGALGRRVAFWDSTTFTIHKLLKDTDAEMANKWLDDKDDKIMSNVISMLRMVEILCLGRYQEVLGDQLSELQALQDKEGANS